MTPSYDVAVLGLGAVGAAAAWRAAVRGHSVIGFEQFTPAHSRGSSHGGARIFRKTMLEGTTYIPLIDHAAYLWTELEAESGAKLFRGCGGVCIGPENGPLIRDALLCADAGGVEIELLPTDILAERYPQFAVRRGEVGIFEPEAGVLDPELCITTMLALARQAGAELRFETRVTGVHHNDDCVRIEIGTESVTARRAILATGAWFTELVPDLELPLQVRRSPLVWFAGPHQELFEPEHFPTFVWEGLGLDGWGIPDVDGRGVMVGAGPSAPKPWLMSASDNDYPIDADDTDPVEEFVRRGLPRLIPKAADAESSMVSTTPDGRFVLGISERAPSLVLAGGFSGHGFKHATASGDIAVDLAVEGTSAVPIELFSPDRFTA